jgi:Zn-finger nucleic acid-binding protein
MKKGLADFRQGKTYYYYVCPDCRKIKLSAGEFEKLIMGRFRKLLEDNGLLDEMVENANQRLEKNLPMIREEKQGLEKRLGEVKNEADNIITRFAGAQLDDVEFVRENLPWITVQIYFFQSRARALAQAEVRTDWS